MGNNSDEQLILLQQKVEGLDDDFKNHRDEFHEHRKEYQTYREEEADRWEHLLASQAELAKAQAANTQAIHELAESSRDLLSAWQAATGTVKTLSALGKFFKWLGSFAIIGVFIKWYIEHFSTK